MSSAEAAEIQEFLTGFKASVDQQFAEFDRLERQPQAAARR